MKKTLSILLALALLLGLTACAPKQVPKQDLYEGVPEGSLYERGRDVSLEGALTECDNLKNTYYKLTQEKKLRVAYYGGSVTQGSGGSGGYCWRTAVTGWFKESFPVAEIIESNCAWGGTGSQWGLFRADTMLLPNNPDLVFIEFAINDVYAARNRSDATLYMDALVRKIRKYNPNCDIVMVFVTDKSVKRFGIEYDQLLAHKDVAQFYGIPYIDVGRALYEEVQKTGYEWAYYVTDFVHPNNNGYKVYADCIISHLTNYLVTNPDASGLSAHEMPSAELIDNSISDTELITADKVEYTQGFKVTQKPGTAMAQMGKLLVGKEGSKLVLEFTGKGVGMLVDGAKVPHARITLDGKETKGISFDNDKLERSIFTNLKYGKHVLELEVAWGEEIIIGGFLIEK